MSTETGKPQTVPCSIVLEPLTPKANVDFSAELKKVINERNMLTSKTRRCISEALNDIQIETEHANRKNKKDKILNEVIESEEKYVRQLEIINEFFIKPSKDRCLLKQKDFDALFGDISTIYKINRELLEELRKGPTNVATAFSNIAPFFKSYSFYASGYKNSLQILQNCHRDNPKFEKFLEMQESRPEVQSKLSALLIAPIQRIPRYRLLLTNLIKLTSPSEFEYASFADSLTKVQNAAYHINKLMEDQENVQRLLELQRCLIKGQPNVIAPGRYLIKEGSILQISAKTTHSQRMHVVLMNDIIMFCKMKRDELKVNSLKCTCIFPLSKCKVQKLLDKGAFKIICEGDEITLYDTSYSETLMWIKKVEDQIERVLENRKTLRKENTVRRPVKKNDIAEYNEVGISPGRKIRKRKSPFVENNIENKILVLEKRKPLRTRFNVPLEEQDENRSFLVTLRPPETAAADINHKTISNDLFVFGKPNVDRGFSFKVNQWLCGIGASVKKIFSFK